MSIDKTGLPGEYRGFNESPNLSVQESALAYAMLYDREEAVINYTVDSSEAKKVAVLKEGEWQTLVEKFRHDPKHYLAYGRSNVLAISTDKDIKGDSRTRRLNRYLDAYLSLQLKLDRSAFPADGEVKHGVPEYIPDGLTDMGSDDAVDPQLREREKIRVDKEKIFQQTRSLFEEIFSKDWSGSTVEGLKHYVANRVANFVYTSMPYDTDYAEDLRRVERSVKISDVLKNKRALCRHHALVAQVLLQAFGLSSRLLKCFVDFGDGAGAGPHAANLVRVNGKWSLLDTTNPDEVDAREVFHKEIADTDIDLNNKQYEWNFVNKKNNTQSTYQSRNNMFYKITGNS